MDLLVQEICVLTSIHNHMLLTSNSLSIWRLKESITGLYPRVEFVVINILWTAFQFRFLESKLLYFDSNFIDFFSRVSNWCWVIIVWGNGLAPNRPQAITWISVAQFRRQNGVTRPQWVSCLLYFNWGMLSLLTPWQWAPYDPSWHITK